MEQLDTLKISINKTNFKSNHQNEKCRASPVFKSSHPCAMKKCKQYFKFQSWKFVVLLNL